MDADTSPLADAPASTGPMARLFAERYELVARRGSSVDVARFDANDLHTGAPVVVRVVHPDLCAIEGFRERFHTEMAAAMATPHPNLAEIHDVGEAEWSGRPVLFTVGEQLAGGSLRDLRDRGRLLSPSQAVMIGLDACRGLDVAHRAGLVHSDVRPANLVFGSDGRLRVTDLGLAAAISHELWKTPDSLNLDRARFASPEQALGRQAEQKSDVYSLCLCLVEAITGQVPFVGDSTVMTLANRVDRLLPVTADLGALASVLERAGRPEPGDRSSVAEFGRALVAAAEKLPRPAPLPLLVDGVFAEAPPAPIEIDPVAATADTTDAAGPDEPAEPQLLLPGGISAPLPVAGASPAAGAVAGADATLAAAVLASEVAAGGVVGVGRDQATVQMPTGPTNGVVDPDRAAHVGASADGNDDATLLAPVVPTSVDPPSQARRAVVPRWALGALVVAVAAFAGFLLFGRTAAHEVPLLSGVEQAEALNLVAEFGWEVVTVDEPSDTVPIGAVVRTDPPGGERLDEGGTLTLFVSTGPSLAVLPELTGVTLADAERLIEGLGAVLEVGDEVFDEVVPAGSVVSWVVPDQPGLVAGDTVVPGTTVVVEVSAGPEPRQAPDLTGKSLVDATAELQTLGLVIVQGPDEFSQAFPVGAIAKQDPPAGTELERGATVTVVVSKGPELVAVPSLVGLDLAGITAALDGAGLVLGEVEGDPGGIITEARSGDTVLAGGEQLPKGSRVDVTLALPAPPPTSAPAGT